MDKKNYHAYRGLKKIPNLLDFEVLMSRLGVSESDSNFIWASTFTAAESIASLDGQLFLNLFLPEGSENDPEKKLFLNRVGAKFQDGLWQVRRRMDQLKGKYGAFIQTTLYTFKTAVFDQMYIKNGRVYGRLLINHSELEPFSRLLMKVKKERPDLRVEHYGKYDRNGMPYLIQRLGEELTFVTVEFGYGNPHLLPVDEEGDFFFILAHFVESGVKAVASSADGKIPDLLVAEDISNPNENLFTFRSNNKFINSLLRALANQFVVVFGFFGTVGRDNATLTAAMPKEQVQVFLRTLSSVTEESKECKPVILEIVSSKDFLD